MQVCPKGEDFITYLGLKTIDERGGNDHDRDTECHRSYGYAYDEGRKGLRPAESYFANNKKLGIQCLLLIMGQR
jgi:hypothetical protein